MHKRRKYGLFNFLVDCVLLVATCGLWIIWILFRESRNGLGR